MSTESLSSSVYVALKLHMQGFPDAHITTMYCRESPISIETVTELMKFIPPVEKSIWLDLGELCIMGEGDQSVVAIRCFIPDVARAHGLLSALGLKHSYNNLIQHVTVSKEMPAAQAEETLEIIQGLMFGMRSESKEVWAGIGGWIVEPIIE
jgi:hypothetical protein